MLISLYTGLVIGFQACWIFFSCFFGKSYDEDIPTLSSENGVGYSSSQLSRWGPREGIKFGIIWHLFPHLKLCDRNLKMGISRHRNQYVLWCPVLIMQSTPTSSVGIWFALRQERVSSLKSLNVLSLLQCYGYNYCFCSCCYHYYCDTKKASNAFSFVFISKKLNFATRKK